MSQSRIIPINKKQLDISKINQQIETGQPYDYHAVIEKYDEYFKDPKQYHKIFTELGFTWEDDMPMSCLVCERNGSCPEHPRDKHLYTSEGRLKNKVIGGSRISELLEQSLCKSKPFRNFKNTLSQYPAIEKLWYEFKNMKMNEEVEWFLQSIQHEQIEVKILK
ncbi:MAG: hypothetical protein HQK49_08105 [Oligoflexia bacterium]|nr:hypothetical protein [Oligoflexia bacterium]